VLAIDASMAVDLCVSEGGFDNLAGHDLVAPPLLRSEALSVLHQLLWRGELTADDAEIAVTRLEAAPIRREEPRGLARAAWSIADDLGWAKTYDAEYVALAQLLECRLLTIDRRLRRGADRLGFIVLPAEL
jgi:predicted nucleic acid-binding protein